MKLKLRSAFFLIVTAALFQSPGSVLANPIQGQRLAVPGQGGDTIGDALEIWIPFSGSGTTFGYANDYDTGCPYWAAAPDVVYTYIPGEDIDIVVDLWGSDYNTKVFIYSENFEVIACNEDFYDNWVSRLEMVSLTAGTRYYIIVDGYLQESGNYEIQVYENQIDIPSDAVPEGEPTLYPGYVDEYNSGCSFSFDQPLMQEIIGNESGGLDFHGHAGWVDMDLHLIDTDWFSFVIGETGAVNIEFMAQLGTRLAQLEPLDCELIDISQVETAWLDSPVTMTVAGPPFSVAWVVVYSELIPPSGYAREEFSYLLSFSGLQEGPVAVEQVSWGAVKSLYR